MNINGDDEKLNLDDPNTLIGDKEKTYLLSNSYKSNLTSQQLETSSQIINKINKSQIDTWNTILIFIEHIPELVLNHYHFQVTTSDEKAWVEEKKKEYKTLAEWLDFLVPGDKPTNPDLLFTEKIKLRSKAMQVKALLNLIIELFERRGDTFSEYFDTPADCLFGCLSKFFELASIKAGLLTNSPQLCGKKNLEGFNHYIDRLISILNFKSQEALTLQEKTQYSNGNILEFVIAHACTLAAEDTHFRNGGNFTNFRKTTSKRLTELRRLKGGFMFLKDGERLPDGKKRPRKHG